MLAPRASMGTVASLIVGIVLIALGVAVAACPSRLLRDQDWSAVLGRRFGMSYVRYSMVIVGVALCIGGLASAGVIGTRAASPTDPI
jgi:hypothetical protein